MTNPETPLEIAKRIIALNLYDHHVMALARAVIEADELSGTLQDVGAQNERARIVAAIRKRGARWLGLGHPSVDAMANWIEGWYLDE